MKTTLATTILRALAILATATSLVPGSFAAEPKAPAKTARKMAPAGPSAAEISETEQVVNAEDAANNPDGEESGTGDLPSVGGESIPVETGKGSKTRKAREPFRRSRLTKDVSEGKADRRRVSLATGEDKVVDLDFDVDNSPQAIQVGNTQISAVTVVRIGEQRRQLIFKPLKGGETTVTVRDAEGQIKVIFDVVVTSTNLLRRAAEIRELLRDIEGLDIKVVGPNIIVDGEIFVPDDWARMKTVTGQKPYADNVIVLARLAPLALTALAKKIQEDISAFAPNVKTRIVNGMLFLEGTVDQIDQATRADRVAHLYFPEARPGNQLAASDPNAAVVGKRDFVYNFIIVNPAPPKKQDRLVRVLVHLVELGKDYSRSFGFKWNPGFTANDPSITFGQGASGSGASGTSFTATLNSLIPKLQSAQDAGFARVLKQGTLIVKSGVLGTFTDGTTIPTTVVGAQGQATVQNTAFGFTAKITPTVLGQGEDIDLKVEVVNNSFLGYNQNSPITSNRRLDTNVYVKSGESAAIGGIENDAANTGFNKGAFGEGQFQAQEGAAQTDPLFSLKRTKSFSKSKSQFVVFVTPQIVEDASQGSEDLKRNFRVKVK
jgi:pilus assembly protein CpaC